MSTIVTGNIATLQLFALIATLVFGGGAIAAVVEKSTLIAVLFVGLALSSIALLFHP